MKYRVQGEEVTIYRVETEDDLGPFRDFVRANLRALACDSETTSLFMYAPGFRTRLVQFGTPNEAWVVPVEHGGRFKEEARRALLDVKRLVFHNGMFDLQVFDRDFGLRLEDMWPKVLDTQILAKLIDPRAKEKGGIGNKLEELIEHYIDPEIAENVKGLMTVLAKKYKTTKAKVFEKIDLDDPEYNLYAGMDVIAAARLSKILHRQIPASAKKPVEFDGYSFKNLAEFEHKVAEICSYMERTGFLLDVEYSEGLSKRLLDEEQHWREVAAKFGVENVNSIDQVAEGLQRSGVKLTERTASGKFKVDKNILDDLIKQGNELAKAVKEAKKAGKWRTTWVDTFLETRDENDRCHPNINTLQARTGRMSITGIPAQTLPSGDWMIRRCFVADPGMVMASVDYMAQELRVLAALSKDKVMIKAFKENADLHLLTARAAFGDHITKDDPERKYAKTVNFGRVYGGGARTVATQTGLDLETAKKVVDGFDRAYPGVTRYSRKLQEMAKDWGCVITATGRRLPVDPSRAYSALNYMVQSTSRDVTCRGLIRLHGAGFTPYLRLPIHDEVLAVVPEKKAKWGAERIGQLMAEQMGPVWIGTEPEVGGRSWGSLYGADE